MKNRGVSYRKVFGITALVFLVGGCTTYWVPGPNAQGTFEQASAHCRLLSRGMHQDPEYIESSNRALSNTAYGLAVFGSILQDVANENDCMEDLGWERGRAPSPPVPTPAAAPAAAAPPVNEQACSQCISSGAADCHAQCVGTMSAMPIPPPNVSSPAVAGKTVLVPVVVPNTGVRTLADAPDLSK
jgi:hypothetical protein